MTNLTNSQIKMIFDLLDWTAIGEIGFDQFYVLVCIVLAHQASTRTGLGQVRWGWATSSPDKADTEEKASWMPFHHYRWVEGKRDGKFSFGF